MHIFRNFAFIHAGIVLLLSCNQDSSFIDGIRDSPTRNTADSKPVLPAKNTPKEAIEDESNEQGHTKYPCIDYGSCI